MTIRETPTVAGLQNRAGGLSAETHRLGMAGQRTPGTTFHGVTGILPAAVGYRGKVTLNSDTSATIEPFRAIIAGTQSPLQGDYEVVNDATKALTIGGRTVGTARIDLLVTYVRDSGYLPNVGEDDVQLALLPGTPHASTPVAPATPPNALVHGTFTVPAVGVGVVTWSPATIPTPVSLGGLQPVPAADATPGRYDGQTRWRDGSLEAWLEATSVWVNVGGGPKVITYPLTYSLDAARSNTWVTTLKQDPGLHGNTNAVVVDNKIHVMGGTVMGVGGSSSTVHTIYDPLTDTWTTEAALPAARFTGIAMAAVGGKIYLIGGYASGSVLATVDMYDPVAKTWTARTAMPTARAGASVAVINGLIYVAGGTDYAGNTLAAVEMYDPVANSWTARTAMTVGKYYAAFGVISGKLIVAGGLAGPSSTAAPTTSVHSYDPTANSWTSKQVLPAARCYTPGAVLDGKLYAIGGGIGSGGSTPTTTVVRYDPVADTWTTRANVPTNRQNAPMVTVDSRIYVMGGTDTSNAQPYEYADDSWAAASFLTLARGSLLSVTTPNTELVNDATLCSGHVVGGATGQTITARGRAIRTKTLANLAVVVV